MGRRMRLCTAPLLFLISMCNYTFIPGVDGDSYLPNNLGPISSVQALEGGNVTLFCDTTPDFSEDEFTVLVWYKNNLTIYSFEIPDQQWSDPIFNTSSRLKADIRSQPTSMTISSLTHDDEAIYQCRVDFKLSPTRNLGINLTIIVLPSSPFFLDEMNNKVVGKVGPYLEGDTLVVRCLVIGGHPPPRISWYSGDILIDSSDRNSDIPTVKENKLYMPLTRDNSATLSCRVSNTNLSPPVIALLDIELYLPAYNVTIHRVLGTMGDTLRAGSAAIAQCTAYGAYPQAELSWWLDHKQLTHHSNQTWHNTSLTAESFLEWTPTVSDNNATLACVSTNSIMAKITNSSRASKADMFTLNVTYSPIVDVINKDGSGNDVVELGSLHLKCDVKANPPVAKIMWYFNDIEIKPDSIWGNRISSQELLLEKTSRMHTGRYACAATNVLGKTRSVDISITVLYPPQCTGIGIRLIKETIHCNVKALPPPDTYFWHLKPANFEGQNLTTHLPILPLDRITGPLVETLKASCEASNGIGSQKKKCHKTFSFQHLRPSQPHQCDISYESGEFQMKCLPVQKATYYDISVWRTIENNPSQILERKVSVGFGTGQALIATGSDSDVTVTDGRHDVKTSLGQMKKEYQAGAKACNRYGCSVPLLLRPTDSLLSKAELPWHSSLTRNVGISVAAMILVAVFIVTTVLSLRLARRTRSNLPPVIQVLQLDDIGRDYLNNIADRKVNASCSFRSCNSDYSDASGNSVPPNNRRRRRPASERYETPPFDATLSLRRESAV